MVVPAGRLDANYIEKLGRIDVQGLVQPSQSVRNLLKRLIERVRDEVRPEATVRDNSVTVVERRPPLREGIGTEWTSLKIAQLRYDSATALWTACKAASPSTPTTPMASRAA